MAEFAQLKNTPGIDPLQQFVKRWRLWHVLRHGLLALVPALMVFFLLLGWYEIPKALMVGVGVWLLFWLVQAWRKPSKSISLSKAAAWLDRAHPSFQHSTELLLLQQEQLSLPARLQQANVARELAPIVAKEKPPVPIKTPLLIVVAVFAAGILLARIWQTASSEPMELQGNSAVVTSAAARAQEQTIKRDLPALEEARIQLAPPAYTRQPATFHPLSDIKAPAGSRITWQLSFRGGVRKVYLTDQNNDTLLFRKTNKGAWVAQIQANKPLFYRIGYGTNTDTLFSDFVRISVIPDEPPRVRIIKPEQYQLEQQGSAFAVTVEAADDYGLDDLYLSLTISRGSGENVSFREEKQWIDVAGDSRQLQKELQLNPRKLGMQPGDELYYRLEAIDTKPPRGQHSRSNTWYYQWQDTAAATSMLSSGLAMDLEPEYFRSQRQIIIDTERLISTQASTPVEKWEKANQDLGVDQKLLRLRYGKFLGEEFESSAGGGPTEEAHDDHSDKTEGEHEEESHEEEGEYGNERHEHDVAGHEAPAGAAPASALMEMFGHAHDTEEGATFYEESIKVKLKAALSEMWEAEKYLRLSQPRQALPYENRALRIIKEVQQASRVYVERVGLDLPSLIPQEHRLKGEQDKILPLDRRQQIAIEDSLAASRKVVGRLSYWEKGDRLSSDDHALLRLSAKEVARVLVQGGPHMRYFYLLNSLNVLLESPVPPIAEVHKVQRGLLGLLPVQSPPTGHPQLISLPQKQFLETVSPSSRE